MHLMGVIQEEVNLLEGLYNHKRKAPAVISEFLGNTTTPVPAVAGTTSAVTNPVTATNIHISAAPVANEAMAPHNLFEELAFIDRFNHLASGIHQLTNFAVFRFLGINVATKSIGKH
jgi:hypothetical protein